MNAITVGGDFEKVSVVLLYDSRTGAIVHVHQSVTQKGATHPDDKELEQEAADQVRRNAPQLDLQATSFLHVDPALLEKRVEYTVDPRTGTLVEKPATPLKPLG